MRKLVSLFVLFATFGVVARAADVTFKASARKLLLWEKLSDCRTR